MLELYFKDRGACISSRSSESLEVENLREMCKRVGKIRKAGAFDTYIIHSLTSKQASGENE